MAEKILPYDRMIVPQETGWWCGPASTQVVLNTRGIHAAERDLAREMGTHTGGTDHIGLIEKVLDRHLPEAKYSTVWMPKDPPSAAQRDRLWVDVKRSIDAGYGVVMNWVAPPRNYPRGVKGSVSPAYGGGTVYHYVAAMGYSEEDRAYWIADSGFRPFGFWVSHEQVATLIPPKGYCFAAASAPASKPPAEPDPVRVLVAATGISKSKARQILPTVQQGLRLSNCTNVNRIAAWLAQMGHESAGFNATEEYQSGDESTDRWLYKGRTWIQITWRSNYEGFSRWAFDNALVDSPDHFVKRPKELADVRWAGIGPAWYWTVARPDINSLCDSGQFDTVTQRINGGQNGAADRKRRYRLALDQCNDLLLLVSEGESTEELLMSDRLYPSVSIYKTPGEGARYTLAQLIQSVDGFVHREAVESAALEGSVEDIDKIFRVAAGKGEYKDAWAVSYAKNFLARLERDNPGAVESYRRWKGIE
jgi:predicted chitinase